MGPLHYEITVEGRVPAEVLEELEEVRATVQPVTTVLTGPLADQSALHGMISRLHGAGLTLVEVRRLPADDGQPAMDPPSTEGTP